VENAILTYVNDKQHAFSKLKPLNVGGGNVPQPA